MRFEKLPLFLVVSGFGLVTAGCAVEPEPDPGPVVVQQPAAVVVEPGYYYEPEYVDVHGYRHPRAYYYYDGRRYVHRDYVPRGYVAREWRHDSDRHYDRDRDHWRR
jgi:hypothetical protein